MSNIEIEVDGKIYGGFISASVSLFLDALSSTFSFTTTSIDGGVLPIKVNQKCAIYIEDETVLTGYVEQVGVEGGASNHTITISGRDKTCDLIDSTIGVLSDITPPVSLKDIIARVINHIGSDIGVFEQSGLVIDDFTKGEDVVAIESGVGAFEYIESMARKRQVLLTSDCEGNVIIARGEGFDADAQLIHKVGDPDNLNNVLRYSVNYDTSDRYRRYIVYSELNVNASLFSGSTDAPDIVDQQAVKEDKEIRSSRQMAFEAEEASSTQEATDRALWEANVRRARSMVYGATVHGYQNQAGRLWALNDLVKVEDEFADINARMITNQITFEYSDTGGSSTTLAMIDKDAYTLSLADPTVDDVGDDTVNKNLFTIVPSVINE